MNEAERDVMRHALGVSVHQCNHTGKPYRNRYHADPTSPSAKTWQGLVKRGLAIEAERGEDYIIYAVTDRGMSALGVAPLDGLEPSERYP